MGSASGFHKLHPKIFIMKTTFICFLMVCASFGFDGAQEKTITGKVTDADDGSAIPGVSVILKGYPTGTATDAQGKYAIRVPSSGGTLVFSFIGYVSREVRIGKDNVINVELAQDVAVLAEEVVTGSGKPSRAKEKKDA